MAYLTKVQRGFEMNERTETKQTLSLVFITAFVMALLFYFFQSNLEKDVICDYDQKQYICDFSGLEGNYHTIKIIEDSMTTELK